MYERVIKGRKIRLANEDYDQLLWRFDAKNARQERREKRWIIYMPCALCIKYRDFYCDNCPFLSFEKGSMKGCLVIIYQFLTRAEKRAIDFGTSYIYWSLSVREDQVARRGLAKIHAELMKFKKVK